MTDSYLWVAFGLWIKKAANFSSPSPQNFCFWSLPFHLIMKITDSIHNAFYLLQSIGSSYHKERQVFFIRTEKQEPVSKSRKKKKKTPRRKENKSKIEGQTPFIYYNWLICNVDIIIGCCIIWGSQVLERQGRNCRFLLYALYDENGSSWLLFVHFWFCCCKRTAVLLTLSRLAC